MADHGISRYADLMSLVAFGNIYIYISFPYVEYYVAPNFYFKYQYHTAYYE